MSRQLNLSEDVRELDVGQSKSPNCKHAIDNMVTNSPDSTDQGLSEDICSRRAVSKAFMVSGRSETMDELP